VAQDAGIFERNGLKSTLQLIPGAPTAISALVAGEVQFAQVGGGAALSAAAAGADLKVLTVNVAVLAYIIEAGPDLKSVTDLKNRRLGVSALGGDDSNITARAAMRHVGLNPDKDVHIVPVGGDKLAALKNGAVDAALIVPPDDLRLQAAGYHPLLDLTTTKLPHAGQVTVTSQGYITSHPDAVQRYVSSIVQAMAKIKSDRAFTVQVLKKYLKVDDEKALGAAYDFYANNVFPAVPAPSAEQFSDATTELGVADEKVRSYNVNNLIDASFVNKAAKAA
jgi:NitT/TauT family transport system substrate-binding protein